MGRSTLYNRYIIHKTYKVSPLTGVGVPETTIRSIREEYSHQLSFTDGEIYRNIRYYDSQWNTPYKKIWVARLSKKKAYYVTQLDRDEHRPLREALDRLLPFVGLWDDLELGWLGRMLPLRCLPVLNLFAMHLKRKPLTVEIGV